MMKLLKTLKYKFTRYFLGCFASVFILGCSSDESTKLYDDFFNLTNSYGQFKTGARCLYYNKFGTEVRSFDGYGFSQIMKIQNDTTYQFRFVIDNSTDVALHGGYYAPDKLTGSFMVSGLQRKSKSTSELWETSYNDRYIDAILFGSVKGIKSSMNNREMKDIPGSGDIFFLLDSVNYKLEYKTQSKDGFDFGGEIDLKLNQYTEVYELFTNKKLTNAEPTTAKQSNSNQDQGSTLVEDSKSSEMKVDETVVNQGSTSGIDNTSSEIKVEENVVKYNYEGRIDKYPIRALINWGEGYHKEGTGEFIIPITGYYYYIKSGVPIEFEGRANGPNNVHLVAQTAGGFEEIDYEESENGEITGTWRKDGKELLIEMHSID